MPPQWAAFAGLAGFVVTAFLALARLSQSAVRGEESPTVAGGGGGPPIPAGRDPAVPLELLPEAPNTVDGGPEHPVESIPPGALLANVALTQGVFGAVLLAGGAVFGIPAWAFGAADPVGDLIGPPAVAGVALGVGLWLASEAGSRVAEAAGLAYDERLRGVLTPESLRGWLVLLAVVLPVIAAVEELMFRAAAIGVVTAGFDTSPWALAVVSSAAFGLGHGAQGRVGILVTGVLGMVLAAGFVLTGSFVTVLVAHYLVNALEFVVHEGLGGGRSA